MIDIESYLLNLKTKLLDNNDWKEIALTRQWASEIPKQAGVYVLKENDRLVYVGETGNLRGRMNDLLDSRHHMFISLKVCHLYQSKCASVYH